MLKLDTMEVDTKLAKEYLQQNPEIQNINSGNGDNVSYTPIDNLCEKFTCLSELIVENKKLLCQLEYLIRNIPIKETEQYNLKLLVNNLLHWSEYEDNQFTKDNNIKMEDSTPCVMLGLVTQIYLFSHSRPSLEATDKTVAICYLFSQLCVKAGLPEVSVHLCSSKKSGPKNSLYYIEEPEYGCVGIITNCSDVDSAVNVFLESPITKPWALRQILIEESAVECFKRAISWKTRDQGDVAANIAHQCSESYKYNGRSFLLDYVGGERQDAVLVTTYRTVKELLSLAPSCLAVSLWASDVAQANEIALKLNTNVWINCFGNFNGPPQTSQAFFTLCGPTTRIKPTDELQSLMKLQVAWAKVNALDRIAAVKKHLKFKPDLEDFVHVSDTFMCCGMSVPIGLVVLFGKNTVEHSVKNLVLGNAVIVDLKHENEQICKLRDAGLPICCKPVEFSADGCKVSVGEFYRKKVIWTTYGTIFAN